MDVVFYCLEECSIVSEVTESSLNLGLHEKRLNKEASNGEHVNAVVSGVKAAQRLHSQSCQSVLLFP